MDYQKIKTLAHLKKAKYQPKSIKDELRENLIYNIQNKINVFQGIHGYEKSVIPRIKYEYYNRWKSKW